MNKEKTQQLIDDLTSAAANFAYEASEPDFCVEVLINSEDGWVSIKQV